MIALCGSPEWLTVGCNDPTSVRLFWGSVPEDQRNEIIIGYSIRVEGPDTTSTPETGRYATSKEVSGLKPSTEYTFSVSAKTVAGSGLAISVSFITPQEGKAAMHTIASTFLYYYRTFQRPFYMHAYTHIHTQLSPTLLLVVLKPASITKHQCRFPGQLYGRTLSLAIQYR